MSDKATWICWALEDEVKEMNEKRWDMDMPNIPTTLMKHKGKRGNYLDRDWPPVKVRVTIEVVS